MAERLNALQLGAMVLLKHRAKMEKRIFVDHEKPEALEKHKAVSTEANC